MAAVEGAKSRWADDLEEDEEEGGAGRKVPQDPDAPAETSVGSAAHASGNCKPCAFVHTRGCNFGAECQFCHLCPPGEKHRRKADRRKRVQALLEGKRREQGDYQKYPYQRQQHQQQTNAQMCTPHFYQPQMQELQQLPTALQHSRETAPSQQAPTERLPTKNSLSTQENTTQECTPVENTPQEGTPADSHSVSEDCAYSTASSDSPRHPVRMKRSDITSTSVGDTTSTSASSETPQNAFYQFGMGTCFQPMNAQYMPAMRVNAQTLPRNATLLSTNPVSSVTSVARFGMQMQQPYFEPQQQHPFVYVGPYWY
eukprot:TRINITY_DN56625_c0_g1_i1.p1 TRINITY_DN56625_c0_g1~~TRINITY_DN56625_c0_g1_i1.p1  ORF type:complete len:345 (-),score=53.14 TRINITY_DN56625_c0_g1_i1:80-1018(-)